MRQRMSKSETEWVKVAEEKVALEGPYKCPGCGGQAMLDGSYLEQVQSNMFCPCCGLKSYVPE